MTSVDLMRQDCAVGRRREGPGVVASVAARVHAGDEQPRVGDLSASTGGHLCVGKEPRILLLGIPQALVSVAKKVGLRGPLLGPSENAITVSGPRAEKRAAGAAKDRNQGNANETHGATSYPGESLTQRV